MQIRHISLDQAEFPPILRLTVHGAPHRREHIATIKAYRTALLVAARSIGILQPIDCPVDLYATMVNPTSPDNDNLATALYRALDGATLGRDSVLVDDGLIQELRIKKFYSQSLEDAYVGTKMHRQMSYADTVVFLKKSASGG